MNPVVDDLSGVVSSSALLYAPLEYLISAAKDGSIKASRSSIVWQVHLPEDVFIWYLPLTHAHTHTNTHKHTHTYTHTHTRFLCHCVYRSISCRTWVLAGICASSFSWQPSCFVGRSEFASNSFLFEPMASEEIYCFVTRSTYTLQEAYLSTHHTHTAIRTKHIPNFTSIIHQVCPIFQPMPLCRYQSKLHQ